MVAVGGGPILVTVTDTITDIPTDLFVFDRQKAARGIAEQGLTSITVGAQTGRGAASVRNYLKGRADPPAGWVASLARILQVHPGDLYRVVREEDLTAVDIRPLVQVRVVPRRQRLHRPQPTA
jgi:hypothetical protein